MQGIILLKHVFTDIIHGQTLSVIMHRYHYSVWSLTNKSIVVQAFQTCSRSRVSQNHLLRAKGDHYTVYPDLLSSICCHFIHLLCAEPNNLCLNNTALLYLPLYWVSWPKIHYHFSQVCHHLKEVLRISCTLLETCHGEGGTKFLSVAVIILKSTAGHDQ